MWVPLIALAGATELNTGVGYRQLQVVDQHQSPLRYVGHGLQLDVGVTHRAARTTTWADLDVDLGSLRAAKADRPVSGALLAGVGVQVGAMATLTPDRSWRVSLGGSVGNAIRYGDGIALHTWGVGVASVDLRVRLERELGASRLVLDAGLPLVGLVSRHVWSLDPVVPGKGDLVAFYQVGTRAFSVAKLQAPYGSARVILPIGESRSSFTAGVEASYLVYPEPRPIHMITATATAGIVVRLGGAP